MAATEADDLLPEGWIVVRKPLRTGRGTKYYKNLETGKTYSSRHNVFIYAKRLRIFKKNLQTNMDSQSESDEIDELDELDEVDVLEERRTEFPEWLPHGWKMHVTSQNAGFVKVYIDPNGNEFYSKPERLGWPSSSVVHQTSTPKAKAKPKPKTKKRNKTNTKPFSAKEVVYERHVDEDLPQGWIKELKISTDGERTRRDPYFTDPVNGYIFRSKKDVMRYLKTGEVSKHAILTKKRRIEKSTHGEASQSPVAKQQKLEVATQHWLHVEVEGEGSYSILLPEVEAPKQGQTDMVAAELESSKQGQHDMVAAEDKAPVKEHEAPVTEHEAPVTTDEAPKQGQDNEVAAEVGLVVMPLTSQVLENNHLIEKANVVVETKITAEGTKTNHVAAHAIDTLPEKIAPNGGLETMSTVLVETMPNNSKTKKDHNLVLPSSKQFPEVKPAFEADEASTEQAVPKIAMKGNATQQLNTDVAMNDTTDIETPSYKCDEPIQNQVIHVNQTKLKTSCIIDDISNPPTFYLYENLSLDPCLDFPFGTLANTIADAAEPIHTVNIMQEENSHETIMKGGNIGEELMGNEIEFMLPSHSSKQLPEVKSKLVISSIFGEQSLGPNRVVEVDEPSQYYGTYLSTMNAHYNSLNMNPPAVEPLEYLKMNNKPIQPQLSFPFGFCSSVPCLGFAHTDAIHVGSNPPIQSPFQHKVGTSSAQMGGSNSSLPVFGVPYAPKSDLSPFYDYQPAGGQQQLPLNPTFVHPPRGSFQTYYDMEAHNQSFDAMNAIHRMSLEGKSKSDGESK